MKRTLAIALLASSAALAAPADYPAQDPDNPIECCLAAEWTLGRVPTSDLSPPAKSAPASKCQVELGGLSCCIGAEWVLAPQPEGPTLAAEATGTRGERPDYCCLASEYFLP
jgi:hypothetical protein